jgi:hypothetical protein
VTDLVRNYWHIKFRAIFFCRGKGRPARFPFGWTSLYLCSVVTTMINGGCTQEVYMVRPSVSAE